MLTPEIIYKMSQRKNVKEPDLVQGFLMNVYKHECPMKAIESLGEWAKLYKLSLGSQETIVEGIVAAFDKVEFDCPRNRCEMCQDEGRTPPRIIPFDFLGSKAIGIEVSDKEDIKNVLGVLFGNGKKEKRSNKISEKDEN